MYVTDRSQESNRIEINSRGQPAEENTRKAKNVKDMPIDDKNIMMSKKQYAMMRPEHHLIEALANYRAIRATMQKIIG